MFGCRHGDNAWGSSNSPGIEISFSSVLVDFHSVSWGKIAFASDVKMQTYSQQLNHTEAIGIMCF